MYRSADVLCGSYLRAVDFVRILVHFDLGDFRPPRITRISIARVRVIIPFDFRWRGISRKCAQLTELRDVLVRDFLKACEGLVTGDEPLIRQSYFRLTESFCSKPGQSVFDLSSGELNDSAYNHRSA